MSLNPVDYLRIIEGLEKEGRLRTLNHGNASGLLDCTSNDYMAIGADAHLQKEFLEECLGKQFNREQSVHLMGSCSSRLLYTSLPNPYGELEEYLKTLYGRETLLFNSGYHTNVGLIQAIAKRDTLIVSDSLIHASAIDGIRLSKAPYRIFPHNDIPALETILKEESLNYSQILLIVESVYSMDGDIAPLAEFVSLKERFSNLLLYIDEAHAFGIRGSRGLGLCEELQLLDSVDIIVCTLSKAAASIGAFVVVNDTLKKYLVNTARSLIFSTALPPVNILWSAFIVKRLLTMHEKRQRLQQISRDIASIIGTLTGRNMEEHTTPIVPFMIGGNHRVVRASEIMREHGVLTLPIRKPTVAEGTERLRISLNAAMTDADIQSLRKASEIVASELLH